ncbi:MAG: E3 binding domain-containing protein, partial [Rubrobacter sp.]|nr:E3 binding domain-containing protein [Rubrobacter sp.]
MADEIHVPELGESVADATVGRWLKQEGEAVSAGDALVELETDKINFEVEAEHDGVLESIAKAEGDTVTVGEVIGTLGEGNGSAPQQEETEAPEEEASSEEAAEEEPEAESEPEAQPSAEVTNGHREDGGRASPSVRKLAEEYGIRLAEVEGSGSGGRITRDDVERLIRSQGTTSAPEKPAEPEQDGKAQQPAPQPAAQNGRADLEERVRVS